MFTITLGETPLREWLQRPVQIFVTHGSWAQEQGFLRRLWDMFQKLSWLCFSRDGKQISVLVSFPSAQWPEILNFLCLRPALKSSGLDWAEKSLRFTRDQCLSPQAVLGLPRPLTLGRVGTV